MIYVLLLGSDDGDRIALFLKAKQDRQGGSVVGWTELPQNAATLKLKENKSKKTNKISVHDSGNGSLGLLDDRSYNYSEVSSLKSSKTILPNEPEVLLEAEVKTFNTFKMGNLEVMTEDLGIMTWNEAMKACADLGDGWRLPTTKELYLLHRLTNGYADGNYWSSTEYDSNNAWLQDFAYGSRFYSNKVDAFYVRAVRAF